MGLSKSHRKYRLSFDLVDFSQSHKKNLTKVTEITDLAMTQLSFPNLAKVTENRESKVTENALDLAKVMENSKVLPKLMENTDLTLIWLPLLKVTENALDFAKVTKNSKVLGKSSKKSSKH